MKAKLIISKALATITITVLSCCFFSVIRSPVLLVALIPLFFLCSIFPGLFLYRTSQLHLRFLCHGNILLTAFNLSAILCIGYHSYLALTILPEQLENFGWSALVAILVLLAFFWNGIASVYVTSVQLGIRRRLIAAILGMLPIVNVFVLFGLIGATQKELYFELKKEQLNLQRKSQQICATKYPILLVHGIFFRDNKYINYWGRIPKELEQNGAVIFYGNHQSAAAVATSAMELTARIKQVLRETGSEKVNIIAHSKGGLDCRYAIAKYGAGPFIASLTTVNTPHKGCLFADYLLNKAPEKLKKHVNKAYNATLKRLGDHNPDFLAAVEDLTALRCFQRELEMPLPEGVFCQSIGSVLTHSGTGQFPLNLSHQLAAHFDKAPNDGLVSETSFRWSDRYTLLDYKLPRGISHADIIDLNRENLDGFDVREFYVDLVADLKSRGL